MQVLRQSTAVDVLIGPFFDLGDGTTEEAGESPSVNLSKNGQALGAKNDATTPVHDADGLYNCELDATDTDTVGTLVLSVGATAGARAVRHEFQVLEETVYDGLYVSGAVWALPAVAAEAAGGLYTRGTGAGQINQASNGEINVDVQRIDGIGRPANVLADWLNEGIIQTADSGTTTTLVDSALTELDGHWYGALLVFRTGTNDGRTAIVTDFDAATDTLTFTPAVPDAVTTETYVLVPGLGLAGVEAWLGVAPNALVGGRVDATVDATGMESGAVDAVWAKTMTELGAVPGVTGTTLAALEWLFLLARNKGTQTSTTKTLRNDADDADIATAAISDDGSIFSREKWS